MSMMTWDDFKAAVDSKIDLEGLNLPGVRVEIEYIDIGFDAEHKGLDITIKDRVLTVTA